MSTDTKNPDDLLNAEEAAAHLGPSVTARWVKRGISERRFPTVKLGRLVMIRRGDLDAYVKQQTRPADPA